MRFVISQPPPTPYAIDYTASFLIVCEGYGDACFADAILERHNITNYQVGCPTQRTVGGEGRNNITKFLQAIATHPNAKLLRGIIVMIDADEDSDGSFREAAAALTDAHFSPPATAYAASQGTVPKTAIVLIPRNGTLGTLEHLLLDAAFDRDPTLRKCVDDFANCCGNVDGWPANKQAKMKLTASIAARCEELPSSSLAWIWNKNGNPIPIDSRHFDHLVGFFRDFSA
jgi:hypothetical protein